MTITVKNIRTMIQRAIKDVNINAQPCADLLNVPAYFAGITSLAKAVTKYKIKTVSGFDKFVQRSNVAFRQRTSMQENDVFYMLTLGDISLSLVQKNFVLEDIYDMFGEHNAQRVQNSLRRCNGAIAFVPFSLNCLVEKAKVGTMNKQQLTDYVLANINSEEVIFSLFATPVAGIFPTGDTKQLDGFVVHQELAKDATLYVEKLDQKKAQQYASDQAFASELLKQNHL